MEAAAGGKFTLKKGRKSSHLVNQTEMKCDLRARREEGKSPLI
jgi:hypothetical protein